MHELIISSSMPSSPPTKLERPHISAVNSLVSFCFKCRCDFGERQHGEFIKSRGDRRLVKAATVRLGQRLLRDLVLCKNSMAAYHLLGDPLPLTQTSPLLTPLWRERDRDLKRNVATTKSSHRVDRRSPSSESS